MFDKSLWSRRPWAIYCASEGMKIVCDVDGEYHTIITGPRSDKSKTEQERIAAKRWEANAELIVLAVNSFKMDEAE